MSVRPASVLVARAAEIYRTSNFPQMMNHTDSGSLPPKNTLQQPDSVRFSPEALEKLRLLKKNRGRSLLEIGSTSKSKTSSCEKA